MPDPSHLEVEYKFELDPSAGPLDLSDAVPRIEPLDEEVLTNTYYDTPALALWSRGATLRHRFGEAGGGKWTLKLPAGGQPAGLARLETSWPGGRDHLPEPARAALERLIGSDPLSPVVTMESRRRRMLLYRGEESPGPGGTGAPAFAEVDDDVVTVLQGERQGLRFRQLEVEVLSPDGPVEEVLAAVRRLGGVETTASKFAVGAGLESGGLRS